MTKVKGIALASYRAQVAGGDNEPVHPDAIKIWNQQVPVTLGFETAHRIGTTSRLWIEDDALWFEADIDIPLANTLLNVETPDGKPLKRIEDETAAIGYTLEVKNSEGRAIKGGTVFEIGLCEADRNMNAQAPKIEVE